jgi:RNA polymerase sigma-70 factor, ECF subfamily
VLHRGPETATALALDVESLYRRYGPQVLRRCRFLLRDEAQAVDAMQDVFVELLRYEDRLRSVAPSSLLHQIATHVCLNRLRGTRRRPEDPEDERVLQIAASEDLERRTFAQRALDSVFGRVPTSSKEIAVLHFVDGMTLEQTAREVGMSVSGVRKRLRALRTTLELLLGREVS